MVFDLPWNKFAWIVAITLSPLALRAIRFEPLAAAAVGDVVADLYSISVFFVMNFLVTLSISDLQLTLLIRTIHADNKFVAVSSQKRTGVVLDSFGQNSDIVLT